MVLLFISGFLLVLFIRVFLFKFEVFNEFLNLDKDVLIDDIDKELLVNSYIRNCVINEGLDEEL